MGLSVFFVRVQQNTWRPDFYQVGASHYATAAQRAIREALKKSYYTRHKQITVRISHELDQLLDPKEQVSLLDIPKIGKFRAAASKPPHAGEKSIRGRR